MPILMHLNYLAVVVAAVVYFIIGFLWFGKAMFGTAWAREVNIKMEGSAMPVMPMIGQLISALIFTIGTAIMVALLGHNMVKMGIMTGIKAALIIIVFFMIPANSSTWFFKGKPVLFFIEWGYQSIGALAAGIIISIW